MPWLPTDLGASLALWLDAADSGTVVLRSGTDFVEAWNDKSGNFHHALQPAAANQPLLALYGLNNVPTIRFDGADDYLTVSGTSSAFNFLHNGTSSSVAFVCRAGEFSTSNPEVEMVAISTSVATAEVGVGILAYEDRAGIGNNASRMLGTLGVGGEKWAETITNDVYSPGLPAITVLRLDADTFPVEQRAIFNINGGIDLGNNTNNNAPTSADATHPLTVGAGFFSSTGSTPLVPLLGDMGEIVITNSELVTDDRQKLEGYLAWKWGGVPETRLWTPYDLGTSLALWLDAADADTITLNGSTVSQWDDKSSNGFNASQATATLQPTYLATGFNGKPTLQTDGGDFLAFGQVGLGRNVGAITCAIVGVHPVPQTFNQNANEIFISIGAGADGATRFATTPNPSASTGDRYAISGRRLDSDGFATVSSSTDSLANRGNPWIRVAQRVYTQNVGNHWTDGTQDLANEPFLNSQTAGVTSDTNCLRAEVFKGAANMPPGTQLSEIVLTHSEVTTDDRQKLEGYLAHKWGLEDNLPVGHPYKSGPPTVEVY
jgi:hypothetical protein